MTLTLAVILAFAAGWTLANLRNRLRHAARVAEHAIRTSLNPDVQAGRDRLAHDLEQDQP